MAPGSAAVMWPDPEWQTATPEEAGMDAVELAKAREYALTGGGSGYLIRGGKLVMAWGNPQERYELKSSTKSIGVTALGLAIMDGKLALTDLAQDRHPQFGVPPASNANSGWLAKITLRHLATQTAGFAKPGGYEPLLFEPGTMWHYSDGGPNWLAECVTLAYGCDLNDLMFERIFTPLGITPNDLVWRKNAYRPAEIDGIPRREFGSGISANVDAMARIGLLYLRGGEWKSQRLLPRDFVDLCRTTPPELMGLPEYGEDPHGNASDHYGLLWWNNTDGTLSNIPRDAYWSWGLYDRLIVVIPSLDLVIARAGKSWSREDWTAHYDVLRPFLEPIVASVRAASVDKNAPYPPSKAILGINWAPASTIIRRAEGSDNWPLTWADDDTQYTAYGDGWGFEPKISRKLSLGFARVKGDPPDFVAENIRSPTGEEIGDGRAGKKASGLLMVKGVLYLWARNAGNAQLAWSEDHAHTWQWADWRFTESFGCPTFLNFGRNYTGARDQYVYVYSLDSDSAYEPADRMVLARVPLSHIRERAAYEFFAGLDGNQPTWTRDIARRSSVFTYPGHCYRSGITYNAGLKRYLWCQTLPSEDSRFAGGFGIYDAPEPWGPWSTVFYTELWDVGPGESSSFPTKWMSADGRTLYLVFSGGDCFSVRQATFWVAP
ncbi:MAG: serine hydrolase [Candidatus Zipacnadales bacterium]